MKNKRTALTRTKARRSTKKYRDALVFDNGSCTFKAGIAGRDEPHVVFEPTALINPHSRIKREKWGIHRGEITDWYVMEEVMHYYNYII